MSKRYDDAERDAAFGDLHTRDSECTVGTDDCCTTCGVYHGDPCHDCQGRGYHAFACATRWEPPAVAQCVVCKAETDRRCTGCGAHVCIGDSNVFGSAWEGHRAEHHRPGMFHGVAACGCKQTLPGEFPWCEHPANQGA